MALASQPLLCPQNLVAISTCSTSTSTSTSTSCGYDRVSSLGLSGRRGLGFSAGIRIAAVKKDRLWGEKGRRQSSRVVASSSEFQNSFTAKDLERDAAKEALLLAIADAGGVDALTSGKKDTVGRINVNEKVLALERLNPTPRPTTSPFLEGLWQFKWAAARSPGLVATRTLLQRFPASVASVSSITILILDRTAKATAKVKLFSSVESTFTLSTKLTAEGLTRLKEEYVEGVLSSPNVTDGSVPSQFKGLYDQLVATVQRLPSAVKEVITSGVKVPLTGAYERQLLISYLDDELMVARDESGAPDVLIKIEPAMTILEPTVTVVSEYVS